MSTTQWALRDALRIHHPIMRSETGPFSGCRCGQVKLGQDVIAHVVSHLHASLNATTAEGLHADWYEMELGYDPDHACCPDCRDDARDHTLHAVDCPRIGTPLQDEATWRS